MSIEKYAKKLNDMAPQLGEQGIEAAAAALDKEAAKADAPWKKALIDFTADSLEKHGPMGVQMASKAVEDLFAGKRGGTKISDITDDLETASDMLAALQNAEADRKTAARTFLRALGQTLGTITGGFIKGLL